ncbi:MAG: thioredoxin domain-containing protein [Akkermansiaceae bacterium]
MNLGMRWICLMGAALVAAAAGGEKEGKPNRLAKEKSPYLLQHAHNPVDWYPWGEEAFEKARKEKKLILLSVGYSTCHWCHVMERESFENKEIAAFLNKNFVSIKLDREERPDVDQVYMTAFQAMTQQSGGWPLNMFLTPDLKPLTGGTYFPPEDRNGQPGFSTVLKQIHNVWETKREEVLKQSVEMHGQMEAYFQGLHSKGGAEGTLSRELVDQSIPRILAQIDPVWGGLGTEMKFPQVSVFRFLLQSGDPKAVEAVLKTCRHMMNGGIHDHVMGGFHRYAVDREWLVPHFEKMLYDQAQLMELYLDAWQMTGEEGFRDVVRGIANYVLLDLTHPGGGFYCAQDAQSEGKEGKCFCWTQQELSALLTADEMKVARQVLGVSEKGNFIDHSDPEPLANQNVLYFKKPRESLSESERKSVASIFKKLAKVRSERVPPATDDKILASWNGLMIGAMARTGRVLNEPKYLKAARKAHDFIKTRLWDEKSRRLGHRWREGDRDDSAQAQSYLLFLAGTRKLYEATLQKKDLELALKLAGSAVELFYDDKNGGFYQGEKRADLVLRLKGQFDGAIPTESAIAAREFGILAQVTGRDDFKDVSESTIRSYLGLIQESPSGMGEMLMSLRFSLDKPGRLVIAGEKGREAMLVAATKTFDPNRIILGNQGPVSEFTAGLEATEGMATAFYCVGQTCQLPVVKPAELSALLIRLSEESK